MISLKRLLFLILLAWRYHPKIHGAVQYTDKLRKTIFIMLTIAFSLIVVGILFLLKNVGLIPDLAWVTLWPSVLIAVGVYLFLKVRHFYSFIRKIHNLADKVEKKFMHPLD
ncbi:MAG: DUF5668 domain-containing protein [bacterium]|nr:DUF5668 domain-containing protein [bacterium]